MGLLSKRPPKCQDCGKKPAAWMVSPSGPPGMGSARWKLCDGCADKKCASVSCDKWVLPRRDY